MPILQLLATLETSSPISLVSTQTLCYNFLFCGEFIALIFASRIKTSYSIFFGVLHSFGLANFTINHQQIFMPYTTYRSLPIDALYDLLTVSVVDLLSVLEEKPNNESAIKALRSQIQVLLTH